MENKKTEQAGTLESNDIMITLSEATAGQGIQIELKSIVMEQYGEDIRNVILNTLKKCKVEDIIVYAVDRGALDCTIEARMLTVLGRMGYMTNIMEGRMI